MGVELEMNDMINPNQNSEIPSHWVETPLGEILTSIVGGGTPSRSNPKYWDGEIPWFTVKDMRTQRPADSIDHISEIAVRESSTNIIPPDTIIIATRIGLGKVIRVPFEAAINQDLKALILPKDIDKGYVEYWILSISKHIESIGSGTTVKGIRLEQVRSLSFPLAPQNEQKRIVAEIEKQFSRLDEAVENLQRVKANLKRYKASVLKAAVEGKLTEQWRAEHPDVEPASQLLERILKERRKKWEENELTRMKAKGKSPKDDKWKKKYTEPNSPEVTGLPTLPYGWKWASVKQIAEVQLGKMLDRRKHRSGKKITYLRNINVRWGHIDTSDLFEMYFKDTELERYGLKAGDVLVCEGGEPGRASVWDGREPEMKYQKALHRVRFYFGYDPSLLVFYLEYLSRSGRITKWFTGSTIKHFTRESFSNLLLPLIPIDEQIEILLKVDKYLSEIALLDSDIDRNLLRADRLRQSILKKAFSGQLVPNTKVYENDIADDFPMAAEPIDTYGAKL